jgi:hypothetical protein
VVRARLQDFVADASPEQVRAWDDSIPPLQREVDAVLEREEIAREYTAILEYELPLESRRPDVVFLLSGAVMVLEFKGKQVPSQADIDQVAAYARDLRCYHRECEGRDVCAVLVPIRASGYVGSESGVHIVGPDALDQLIAQLDRPQHLAPISPGRFLKHGAYRPLPTLVRAARDLFEHGDLPYIHRARACTDPAVDRITEVIHEAARSSDRRLVLLTGVPGSGKTLVGLRIAHAHFLDDLAVERGGEPPTAPAVFLSGNGPLVEVLQYELKAAGGGGKAFVRGVKDYVKTYSRRRDVPPSEQVLVFDEAQRAWDAEHARHKHKNPNLRSEPEEFVEFAERIPGWCVIVGLIGGGQEIHQGEEGGLVQWRNAIEQSPNRSEWTIHAPPVVAETFRGLPNPIDLCAELSLDDSIRFHLATDLHLWVQGVLEVADPGVLRTAAGRLESGGLHLRITRDLDVAKAYLWERYSSDPRARFGMLRSARDKGLEAFGVPHPRLFFPCGPWYGDPGVSPASCRRLTDAITEFQAQGLELDSVLLAWGTDLMLDGGNWTNRLAKRYQRRRAVRDPLRLRMNAYRVLLTRGRDGTVIFVPSLSELDETHEFLVKAGCRVLT